MEFISASKLKKFRKCPYSLQEEYTANPATNFGTSVHAGIAAWFRGNEQYFAEYIKSARTLAVDTTKDPEAATAMDFAKSLGIDRESVLTVESDDGNAEYFNKKFFEVKFSDRWGIRGAMDLVYIDEDGNLNIVDWKTGQSKEEDDLQLAVYALCAWKIYGSFPCIKTTFVYVQQGYVQTSSWDSESLVSALTYVEGIVADYLNEMSKPKIGWKQTPHSNCKYCSLRKECVQFNRQLQTQPEPKDYELDASLDNLPKLLEAKDRIDAIAKAAAFINEQVKSKIESVVESAGGIVNYEGRTIQLKEKVTSYDYNLPQIFVDTQKLTGAIPAEICKFSSTGAKAFAKTLDKEQKKAFEDLVLSNKTVAKRCKTLSVTISKEPMEITDESATTTDE